MKFELSAFLPACSRRKVVTLYTEAEKLLWGPAHQPPRGWYWTPIVVEGVSEYCLRKQSDPKQVVAVAEIVRLRLAILSTKLVPPAKE